MKDLQLQTARALLLIYALLLGYLSLRAFTDIDIQTNDKVMHFVAYGLFAVLGCLSTNSRKVALVLLMSIVSYGAVLELLQGQLAYRDASFADFIANTLGVIVGAAAVRIGRTVIR